MNTDIRLSVGFWAHPKTKKLAKRCGLEGVRSLQVLWLWAAQNKPDGNLTGMDEEDIALAADWNGEGLFVDVLKELGWIEADTETKEYVLHDWEEHNPWQAGAKDRSTQASNAARSKWGNAENQATRSQRLSEARRKGTHTKEEWQEMVAFFDNKCVRCGKDDVEIVKDHITPIYQGGSDGIDNIQPLCRSCNASKGPENQDWRSHCADVLGKKMPAKWAKNACEMSAERQHDDSPSPLLSSPNQDKGNINAPPLPPKGGKSGGKREPTGNTKAELQAQIADYTHDEELRNALEAYREMRERIRKPLTAYALKLALKHLGEMSAYIPTQIAIVNQSVLNSWQALYPLKGNAAMNGQQQPRAKPGEFNMERQKEIFANVLNKLEAEENAARSA